MNQNLGSQFSDVDNDPHPGTVTRRLLRIYDSAVERNPETAAKGMHWYEAVHDAAAAAGRSSGKGTRAAAGVVAAVSPNMDWERNNIGAFDEIDALSHQDWKTIVHSAQQGTRTDEAREALRGYGISAAGDRALLKAHLIWHGGRDPEEVLPRQTAPKTNSFFHNINDVGKTPVVTIDGRAADEVVDAMRPWSGSRGIASAATKTGKTTRYEEYEDHYRRAARLRGVQPHQMQAVTWEEGKNVERNYNPERKQGDMRAGQSYQQRVKAFQEGALT